MGCHHIACMSLNIFSLASASRGFAHLSGPAQVIVSSCCPSPSTFPSFSELQGSLGSGLPCMSSTQLSQLSTLEVLQGQNSVTYIVVTLPAPVTAEGKHETAKPCVRKHFMAMLKKDQCCCEFAQWPTHFQLGPSLPKGPM